MKAQDRISQAVTWIEFQDDFVGYMQAHEYGNDELLEAVQAYTACCEAYRELAAEKDSIEKLAKHFSNV